MWPFEVVVLDEGSIPVIWFTPYLSLSAQRRLSTGRLMPGIGLEWSRGRQLPGNGEPPQLIFPPFISISFRNSRRVLGP